MRQKYAFAFMLFATLSAFTIINNGGIYEKILDQLTRYVRETPQEKVYLHFDKPYYMAGETMWFKGYLFDAVKHGVDTFSNVLYVDLVDPMAGKVLIHNTLKCVMGMTDGSFKLPDDLPEKVYTVRAYTNYMRNFSDDWFFQKPIKIWQGAATHRTDYTAFTDVADCSFFPEGGLMVNGLDNRVAFKAVNALGNGVAVEGVVLEEGKDTVLNFNTTHAGMGAFRFVPKSGKNYIAKVKKSDGTEGVFKLPNVEEHGLTLAVDNISNRTNIKIFINNTQPQSADKAGELIVIAHQRGVPCFSAKAPNTKKNLFMNMPRAMIQDDGIVQITLFDAEGRPRCERLVFVQQNKKFNLKVTANKAIYKPREKVTLSVEATDSAGKPVVGNFSLAATDGTQVLGNKYDENLMTYLLLSSDLNGKDAVLRGVVEDPAYYFDKSNKTAIYDLDVLMMTQGWRRFVWRDVLADKELNPKFFLEPGLSVTGKAVRPNGKVSSNRVKVTLAVRGQDKKPIIQFGTTNIEGEFGFYALDFADTATIFVQAIKEKGLGDLAVTIDSVLLPKVLVTKIPFMPMAFDATDFANFLKTAKENLEFERQLKLNKDQLLQTVEITGKKKTQSTDLRRIYSRASSTLDMTKENCGSYLSILDYLQGRVAGLQVMGSGLNAQVMIRNGSNVNYRLDGIPVNQDAILNLSPCDIEAVDVLKGADAAVFGLYAGDGVIAVLTKQGNPNYDYTKDPPREGAAVQKRLGYTTTREFYAPKYDTPLPEHEFKDFRSTLFWQPYIQTDENGKATVVFWNSDAKTTINVVTEGVSQKGGVAVAACVYEVK